ncbi:MULTISPECIES: virulence RhuM family protein [unclassified Adlercreutzia]|uniref:virulence RhuM family protein n=1 Tax=unclassified Adlercreutzia TaxID=2636013 RepID=UPI00197FCDE1|nr:MULTISPECIES: virulence RhuM family protein [unclassified Adlercreutzia]
MKSNEIIPAKPGDIVLYQSEAGVPEIECVFHGENMWLSQAHMVDLYRISKKTISEHINNIIDEGELDADAVVRKFRTTAADGKNYQVNYYSLEMVIAVGYRVRGNRGTQFRKWATVQLKEYLQKGFNLNDKALKNAGGGTYWKELLARIRDIRSSEKVLYRQVLDLYATSIDYDPKADESVLFFKTVQNKIHYAAHGHTAAEVIMQRANAELPFMGLTTFEGEQPTREETEIAKNYLNEKELQRLNNLVSAFFDLAEMRAEDHQPMCMKDWIRELDDFAQRYGKGLLEGSGKANHKGAITKAHKEYEAYRVRISAQPTRIDCDFLEEIKGIQKY